MNRYVLDASALMALLRGEQGAERVAAALHSQAVMSTVNLSEVLAKLIEGGVPVSVARAQVDALQIEAIVFDSDLADRTAQLRVPTKSLGLSFADRACLATAAARDLPALTADKQFAKFAGGASIELIR